MDRRLAILETEFIHIKGTLNELRGKLDAANESIFDLREDMQRLTGELRTEIASRTGDLRAAIEAAEGRQRVALEKSHGELEASLEKSHGELKAAIEKQSGELRAENWKTLLWYIGTTIAIQAGVASVLGLIARMMKWI